MNNIDAELPTNIMFTDESTFHASSHVKQRTTIILGREHPRIVREHTRGSPIANVWRGNTSDFRKDCWALFLQSTDHQSAQLTGDDAGNQGIQHPCAKFGPSEGQTYSLDSSHTPRNVPDGLEATFESLAKCVAFNPKQVADSVK